MLSERDNKTVNINLRVTEDLKKELVKLADNDRRSLSDFLRMQIENLVEKAKKK